MTDKAVRVSVRILEKEYQVACLPEERSELLDSAEYLNLKMREIRDGGNIIGLDRIAVMAALNLANELLKLKRQGTGSEAAPRVRQVSCKMHRASLSPCSAAEYTIFASMFSMEPARSCIRDPVFMASRCALCPIAQPEHTCSSSVRSAVRGSGTHMWPISAAPRPWP